MLPRARGGPTGAERRVTPLLRSEEWPVRDVFGAVECLWRRPGPRGGPLLGGCLGPVSEGPEAQRARAGPHELWDHRGGLDPRISRRPVCVGRLA
ncbi:hypothetical protein NDU88_000471 [Pleurodeles waltl]|uniref:Uncharacterized protein n=1 Tax=Pleurodeles waltl TaxID=8319 RepID=A0AAV7VWZ7_PLEWA|nr:hypothetical protein NDU88_000471 [Pleurodeles waltl]